MCLMKMYKYVMHISHSTRQDRYLRVEMILL